MVKPTYTLWGYLVGGPRGRGHVDGPWASCDVPNTVPDQLAPLLGVPVEAASPFKTEGGDKSFNGKGDSDFSRLLGIRLELFLTPCLHSPHPPPHPGSAPPHGAGVQGPPGAGVGTTNRRRRVVRYSSSRVK